MSSFSPVLKLDIPSPGLKTEKINLSTNGKLSSSHKRCFVSQRSIRENGLKKKSEWKVTANCHLPHTFLGHALIDKKNFWSFPSILRFQRFESYRGSFSIKLFIVRKYCRYLLFLGDQESIQTDSYLGIPFSIIRPHASERVSRIQDQMMRPSLLSCTQSLPEG